jgi:dUTP pyrophosphatase
MRYVDVEFMLMPEYSGEYVCEKSGNRHTLPRLPDRKRETDAGYDCYSAEDGVVPAGGCRNFHTGVRLACPIGWFYSIRGRSGLGFSNVEPFIGTLDATYNGELRVLLSNASDKDFEIKKGDRIAQIIFEEQISMRPREVKEFSPEYDKRGVAGFGASGR